MPAAAALPLRTYRAPAPAWNPSAGEPLPTRILIAKWGENANTNGAPIHASPLTHAALPKNQAAHGRQRVPLDFEHQTVPGHPGHLAPPVHVAAHGAPLAVPGEGIYLEDLVWTPHGQAHARDYPDISPAVHTDKDGNILLVHSAALTHTGAIPDLRLFTPNTTNTHTAKSTMLDLDLLRQLLKLPPESTESDLNTALQVALETQAVEATEPPETEPAAPAADAMKAMSARLEQIERRQILAEARAQGKVIPAALADAIPDTATLRALAATIPPTVPLQRHASAAPAQPAQPQLTPAERDACRALNITEARYLAANPR